MSTSNIFNSIYASFDGPIDDIELTKSIISNQGDLPKMVDESEVIKAFADQGIQWDQLIKGGRRNLANLTPVRRRVVRQNGTVYMKTVYVKKEEITDSNKSRAFIDQSDTEVNMQVGDKVVSNFIGYSTGAKYKDGHFKIKEINDGNVVLQFTKPYDTNNRNNFTYSVGAEVTVPRTSEGEWSKDTAFKKWVDPATQRTSTTSTSSSEEVVNSIDQISVGDEVMVKMRGADDAKGEVKYIHPQGNFIDIKVGDKTLRRKLGRFSTVGGGSQPSSGLTKEKVEALRQAGVSFTIPNGNSISIPREDRSRQVGEEEYQVRVQIDRHGNPNPRGRSSRMENRTRPKYYQYTESERDAMRANAESTALVEFNNTFGGFNFETYINETRQAIKSAFPSMSDREMGMSFSIRSNGNFDLRVDNSKFQMTRNFTASTKKVYHAYFKVFSNANRGNGLGKNLFKALYRQYRNAGVKTVGVSANIDVGGYAWGRYGFTSEKSQAQRYVNSFDSNVGRTREGYTITRQDADRAKQVFNDFYRSNTSESRFPMNLLCCIGPNNKAGKGILKNTSWSGKLDLTNNTQRTHFENYIGFSS